MMRTATRDQGMETSRRRGTVAVVTTRALEFQLASVLHAAGHNLVLIGSMTNAYSQIRCVTPDLIIVYFSCNEVEGCQLLSMLALDRDTSQVPVVTYITKEDANDDSFDVDVLAQLNTGSVN